MLESRRERGMLQKFNIIIIAFVGAILFFFGPAARDFTTRGEAREVMVAQSMLQSGTYVLGVGYNNAVPSKPPLLHWAMSAAAKVLGELNETAARLPSSILSLVFICVFMRFLSRFSGASNVLLSAGILLTSVEWHRSSIEARVDMPLSVLIGIGLLALFAWEEEDFEGNPFIAQAAFGLATLAKGPVSVVLPGLIFAGYLLVRRRGISKIILSSLQVFIPAGLFYAVWYGLAVSHGGDRFIDKVYAENVQRFAGTMEDDPHKHSAGYLFGTLLLGFMPWTIILGAVLVRRLSGFKDRLLASIRAGDPENKFLVFCWLVVAGFLVFYSIPSSKRSVYLLPAYPFAAFLISSAISRRSALDDRVLGKSFRLFSFFIVILGAAVCMIFGGYLPLSRIISEPEVVKQIEFVVSGLKSAYLSSSAIIKAAAIMPFVLGLIVSVYPRIRYPLNTELGQALALVTAIYLSVNAFVLPGYSRLVSPKAFAAAIVKEVPSGQKIYSFGNEFYALGVYTQRMVYRLEDASPKLDGYVVLYEKNMSKFEEVAQGRGVFVQVLRSDTPVFEPDERLLLCRIAPL